MILQELIKANTWPDVKKSFLYYFPKEKDKIKQYHAKYKQLRTNKEELNKKSFKLIILKDHKIYHLHTETKEFKDLSLSFESDLVWLNVKITKQLQKEFTDCDILALCLFDMCIYGFTDEEKQKYLNQLREQRNKTQ